MIKVKDGYAKLIGTTYQGSATQVLLSNGGDLEYSASSKASTLVQRNARQYIYATYFNSAISDEALTDIGSVYVRNTSDTFIRRVSKTQFYSILDDKFVTLDTTQSITGAKTFSTSVRFANNASIIQNQNDTSNYTTILKWYKNGASRNTYDPSIGQHNTGGDGNGSICILPYPTATSPWYGTVGLFISKGVLKLDGKSVALAENYYTKTESDERYVNVTGDTMTGPLIVKATITGTQLISTIATGTSPLKVTSTTVVTNLNSDLLDGYHSGSFESYRLVVIDASGLNNNTWYPVTMSIGNSLQTRIRIEGNTSANASWNSRGDKHMALILDYTVNGSSWGWTDVSRAIHRYTEGAGTSSCLRGLGQLTNSSTEYVFVRGGAKYNFYVSRFIVPTLRTSTYTSNSQSVSPTTTAPAAIAAPSLTFSAGKFSALTYYPITGRSTVNIPTNTSHLTNDSGFWTGTRYWANIAVSTASSTSTQPTFNTCYTSNWFRSTGSTGWYSQTYGGGWYMSDSTWLRAYNGKAVYTSNAGSSAFNAAGGFYSSGSGGNGLTIIGSESTTTRIKGQIGSSVNATVARYEVQWYSDYARFDVHRGSSTNISKWSFKYNSTEVTYLTTGGHLYANGFHHRSMDSNSYVLLAGGSYKALTDFAKGNAGSATKGVYVTGGTVTAMTYSLSANLNSGTAGKLAYYSSATTVASYGSTVGASNMPIYISNGIPYQANSYKVVNSRHYFNAQGLSGYIYVVRYGMVVCVSISISNGGNGSTGTTSILSGLPSAVYTTGQTISKGGGSAQRAATFYITGSSIYVNSSASDTLSGYKVAFAYITSST